ncbi:MAG: hypothetical protein JSS81_16345 [Acidobacteria bacterium]|nr:hypothetical protein [Acidobacteriota bacterium]
MAEKYWREIIERKWIVEFDRKPYDKHKLSGFVLDVNDDFTLIHQFDRDWIATDGYCVFRNESVRKFWVHDKEEYYLNEVVKLKKIEPRPVPEISIESWPSVLRTVSDNYPLIVIESELIYKNQCNIGILRKLGKKKFSLLEIDPTAVWYDSPIGYKLKDLTMVGFDGAYENTLWEISESRKSK